MAQRRDPGSFHMVLVCTGNRFRSPLFGGYVRALTPGLPVVVKSMGVQDVGGAPPVREAVTLAAESGVDISSHRARPLDLGILAAADLVIGFERAHVARSVVDGGASYAKTFGLVELVRLLEAHPGVPGADPVERARRAVTLAHARRAPLRTPWRGMEIGDPLGGPPAGYRAAALQLHALAVRLTQGLFGPTPR